MKMAQKSSIKPTRANKSIARPYLCGAQKMAIKVFVNELAERLGVDSKDTAISNALNQLGVVVDTQKLSRWRAGLNKPKMSTIDEINQALTPPVVWLNEGILLPQTRFVGALKFWEVAFETDAENTTPMPQIFNQIKGYWFPTERVDANGVAHGKFIDGLNNVVPMWMNDLAYFSDDSMGTSLKTMLLLGQAEVNNAVVFENFVFDLATLAMLYKAKYELDLSYGVSKVAPEYSLALKLYHFIFSDDANQTQLSQSLTAFLRIDDSTAYMDAILLVKQRLAKWFETGGESIGFVHAFFDLPDMETSTPKQAVMTRSVSDIKTIMATNLTPAHAGQFEYTLWSADSSKGLCVEVKDFNSQSVQVLPPYINKNFEKYLNNLTTYSWGYAGEGPRFLVKSLLSHHFGHQHFRQSEVDKLLAIINSLTDPDDMRDEDLECYAFSTKDLQVFMLNTTPQQGLDLIKHRIDGSQRKTNFMA